MNRCIKRIAVAVSMVCGLSAFGQEGDAKVSNPKDSKDFSLRIAYGTVPGVSEAKIDGGPTLSGDAEMGGRLEILAVKRFFGENDSTVGGMFGGGGFISGGQSGKYGGNEVTISAFGGMIQGGVAIKLGERFVLEAGPYLGIGGANVELTGFDDGSGPYAFFGVKAGAFIMLGERVDLGLELGYEGFAQKQEFSDSFGNTADVTFTGNGARVAIVLAIKF